MQQRELGKSGLHISTIGLGSWAIGGWMWGGQDDAASEAAIHAAVDHGVNWIDTAPIYGGGHSETVVGRALRSLPASRRPLVFTKFGVGADPSVSTRTAGLAEVSAECGASLRRLGVDHISSYSAEQLAAWRATGVRLHSLQALYSILRPAAKSTVIPWCAEHATEAIAYSPLFRGLLRAARTKTTRGRVSRGTSRPSAKSPNWATGAA